MMKKFTSRLSCVLFAALCGIVFTSCGGNETGVLTTADVESAVEKELFPLMDYYTTETFKVGYYQENDSDDRYKLRQLAAAGVITYKAECVIENRRSYWGNRKVEHIFVTVALTKAGQKLTVSDQELEEWKAEIAKRQADQDMQNADAGKSYPEYAVMEEEDMPVIDDQPVEPKPEQETAPASQDSRAAATPAATPAAPEYQTAYEKALEKVSTSLVNVKLYKVDIYKVRNILCTPAMLEQGKAQAEVIMEIVDVTPFGRILGGVLEGDKRRERVDFIKYTDGWVVED